MTYRTVAAIIGRTAFRSKAREPARHGDEPRRSGCRRGRQQGFWERVSAQAPVFKDIDDLRLIVPGDVRMTTLSERCPLFEESRRLDEGSGAEEKGIELFEVPEAGEVESDG